MRNALFPGLPALITAALVSAGPVAAATYQITMAGQTTTFDAPLAGGAISNLSVSVAGVIFDTPQAGGLAPVYDPIENDIQGAGGLFGYFANSIAGPGCAIGTCLLEFEDSNLGLPPKVWAVFPLINGTPGAVIASGSYTISSIDGVVPLPASVWLLGAGLAALTAFARVRSLQTA